MMNSARFIGWLAPAPDLDAQAKAMVAQMTLEEKSNNCTAHPTQSANCIEGQLISSEINRLRLSGCIGLFRRFSAIEGSTFPRNGLREAQAATLGLDDFSAEMAVPGPIVLPTRCASTGGRSALLNRL